MSYFAGIAAVYWKDVLLEFRTRQSLSTMFTFCLTIVIIFNFV
ncbi:MAG TPA: cytochrome C biogenesis protein, partial [Bacteroidetes bacterium]|nr:cytochrome C biogenesis protein [Bacteroidota bacterium]